MDWSERRHVLDYDSSVALRYHGRRKAFLDGLARATPALSVIFGSATFAGIMAGKTGLAAVAGLLVTAMSAINLAFGWSDRARLHERLFREWAGVQGALAQLADGDEQALRALEAHRTTIDADSPNQLTALSVLCENEEKLMRRVTPLYRVGRFQRIVSNWLTLPGWKTEPQN